MGVKQGYLLSPLINIVPEVSIENIIVAKDLGLGKGGVDVKIKG